MPRDKARPEQRERACPGSAAFPCAECGEVFPNRKSLLSHTRVKHSRWSDCARAVGPSSCCPVCCMQFSSRTRLIAHLSEIRSRGKRIITCGGVVRAGSVREVPQEAFQKASRDDREARRKARKRGCTQPLSVWPAKRLRCGGSLAAAASEAQSRLRDRAPELVPPNAAEWTQFRPVKRLRMKTSLDEQIALGNMFLRT